MTIQPASGSGASVLIQFDAHKSRTALPDSLTFVGGAKYKLTGTGKTTETTAYTVPLDRTAAAWFMSDHCEIQARALLKTL